MKKYLALLLALVLVCTCLLGGCKKNEGGSPTAANSGEAADDSGTDTAVGPSMEEVCGVYYIQSANGKSAWDYAVDRILTKYAAQGVDEETAVSLMAEYGADENDPASLYCLTLKPDGTATQSGLIGTSEPVGKWSLEGSTVVLDFIATERGTYSDGTITRTNSFGDTFVLVKAG